MIRAAREGLPLQQQCEFSYTRMVIDPLTVLKCYRTDREHREQRQSESATTSLTAVSDESSSRHRGKKRRRAETNKDQGEDEEEGDILVEGGRAFCRLGSVFTPIFQIVTNGVQWELQRDKQRRQQASNGANLPGPDGHGNTPTNDSLSLQEEIREIKPSS